MKHKIWLMVMVLVMPAARAQTLDLSFEKLEAMVREGNGMVGSMRAETEAAQQRQGSLKRSFFPSLHLYGAQESLQMGRDARRTQPAYGAEANLNLFNGGRDALENEQRAVIARKKSMQERRIFSEELQKARIAYWETLFGREREALLESTRKVNEQNLRAAEKRIKSGVATESDRVEFEMKAVDLKREAQENRLRQAQAERELKVLLNLEPATSVRLSSGFSHDHEFESLAAHTPADHEFLYKETEMDMNLAGLKARSQARVWWPRLDTYAAYNQYNEREKEFSSARDRTESVFGLRLSMSVASGLEASRESAALRKEAESMSRRVRHLNRQIESHVENELADLRFLHDQVHDAEENIVRAEKYYRMTQSEYARGVKNSPDVLGASQKLYEMRSKRLEIIRDFQVARAHLLAKMGR